MSFMCSSDIYSFPGDVHFFIVPLPLNWLNQSQIALLKGGSLPCVWHKLHCTVTVDLLLANQVTHCAFCCTLAIILTLAVALLMYVMHAHGVCLKDCVCACIRRLYALMKTLLQIPPLYFSFRRSYYFLKLGPLLIAPVYSLTYETHDLP